MKHTPISLLKASVLLMGMCSLHNAHAGMDELINEFSNPVEREAAKALLRTYNDLIENSGCDDYASADPGSANDSLCTGDTFKLFSNVRQIIHTANDITNSRGGEENTEFSLLEYIEADNSSGNEEYISGLGDFLRWNAGEEYAAQGSMSSDFLQGQTFGLSARLSTLRMGASAFGNTNNAYNTYALANNVSGGGASGDAYSRWSGFLNYTSGSGTKAPTGLEDAFDVDSGEITGGIDYRIDSNWVAGVVLGYTDQELNFDGTKSIVDGGINSDGYSVLPFALYQDDNFYLSFSGGYQSLSFDTQRIIRYAIVDTETQSTTDSSSLTYSSELGYSIQKAAWVIEPFYKNNYSNTRIDAFTERDVNDDAYNLEIGTQRFSSLAHSLGLKLQYTMSTNFGVVVPFASYQVTNERHTGNTIIAARFANAVSTDSTFLVATDENDTNYAIFTAGFSSVVRGGRQTQADTAASGGIQLFLAYKRIEQLDDYEFDAYSAGVRYEF